MNAYRVTQSIWAASGDTGHYGQCGGSTCNYGPGMTAGQVDATTILLLANPANGYNQFVEDGHGSFDNVLGLPMIQ